MAVIQYGIFNDIHFPKEDRVRYARALSLMSHFPDLRGIYLNGDIMEIESVSSHPKSPLAQRSLLAEIEYGVERFFELKKMFPDVPVTYIAGNHEHRVLRYIRDVSPEMYGLIDCPKLLRFDELGWRFVDYGPAQWVRLGKTRDLWLRHEPLVGGANHAKGSAEKAYVSLLYGHTHVFQQYFHKKMGPEPFLVSATSCGWLGDINDACFDYRGPRDNWVSGFTRVDCDEETGEYEIRFIRLD